MNQKKLNNTIIGRSTYKSNQSGQALLIIVMLLAAILTIVMTLSVTTTTQTQLTKDQEEVVKIRAAADSALEEALSEGADGNKKFSEYEDLVSLYGGKGIDLDDSYITVSASTSVTPLVEKDAQFTYYLSNYVNGGFTQPMAPNETLKIYYGNTNASSCDAIALEFTIISGPTGGNYITTRYIADTANKLGSTNNGEIGTTRGSVITLEGTNFWCEAEIANATRQLPADARLLFIRALYADTRIGFEGSALKPQGKTVRAIAKSTTGITKTVEVFQSFPQLQANMFVTSF